MLATAFAAMEEVTRARLVRHVLPRAFFCKYDSGAYGGPAAHVDPQGSATFVTGDPLFLGLPDGVANNRRQQTAYLHSVLLAGDYAILSAATGVFALVHYSPQSHQALLAVDKLGIRPLYTMLHCDWLLFSSQLAFFSTWGGTPHSVDLRGAVQAAAFGYTLGSATTLDGVSRLEGSTYCLASKGEVTRHQYWEWGTASDVAHHSGISLSRTIYQRFRNAVARRLAGDRTTISFLSGGLDSRCVVTALVEDATVHTVTFEAQGRLDALLSRSFAARVGTIHHAYPHPPVNTIRAFAPYLTAALKTGHELNPLPERPRLVWSGDGGSVALGHVYLSPSLIARFERDWAGGAAHWQHERGWVVPRWIFRPQWRRALSAVPLQTLLEELAKVRGTDVGRSLHRFLLANDQRHHLDAHFETIHQHGIEYHLPFFDSALLDTVLSAPSTGFLLHKFYHAWLNNFPDVVRSVPWQTYPGHEPCPLPVPSGWIPQWNSRQAAAWSFNVGRSDDVRRAATMVARVGSHDKVLSKRNLRAGYWAYRLGLRDLSWAFQFAGHFLEAG